MQSSEQALRESEEKFRTLAETTDMAIFVWRQALLYVNPAACAITGYTVRELLGLPAWDAIIHPDDRAVVRERGISRLRGEEVPPHYEFRILARNGDVRWVDFTAGLIRYNGEPAVVGTAFNITERKRTEERLLDSERKMSSILRNMQDTYYRTDIEGRLLMVSASLKSLMGYELDEVLGKSLADYYMYPEMRAEYLRALQAGGGRVRNFQSYMRRKDGSGVWVATNGQYVYDDAGRVIGVEGTARDITELRKAQEELFHEKERLAVTLESIGDGVVTAGIDGLIEYLNPVAEGLTGWPLREAIGQPLAAVLRTREETVHRPLLDPVRQCMLERRSIRHPEGVLVQHRDGSRESAVEFTASPLRDHTEQIIGTVIALHDVTTLRNMARQLAWQARHDPLTGLINRSEFELRLGQALESARGAGIQHALCYLDLDQFKIVNDTCGHVAGDELLKQLTSQLQTRVRETDTLARLGGDEFGILLEHCPMDDARETAETLREVVKRFRFTWQDKIFDIGASIGVVPITADSGSLVEVLSAADSACYIAKDHGRNRIHIYEPEDSALVQRRGEMQWVHRVSQALGENRFRLFLQQAMPLVAGDRDGYCEILVRMVDEQGNMVPPMAFIPAAERYQMMPALDRWVIKAALDALQSHSPALDERSIYAINLSGQSLCDEHFLDSVVEIVDTARIDPARICFEITETAAIANLVRATRFIRVLKEMGCRFALDDFGSGLSSFSHLKHLPVDFLKIDGSFVRDMARDPVDAAMVEAINRIGQVMGIRTIAEAVESRAILERLRALGVGFAQGTYVAAPRPFDSGQTSLAV
jgi:diguanylate cyclase (GGDEF)-like protein/PAS domain S-box-containing protein